MMLAQLSRNYKNCIRIIRLLGSSATSLTRRDPWQSSSKASARRDCNRPSALGFANLLLPDSGIRGHAREPVVLLQCGSLHLALNNLQEPSFSRAAIWHEADAAWQPCCRIEGHPRRA